MSKDSKPEFRQLYKNKGKKLSNEREESKLSSKIKINSKTESLNSHTTISPVIRNKMLNLRINPMKQENEVSKEKILTFKSNKKEIQYLVLSFGTIYQRALGESISSRKSFHEQFLKSFPNIQQFSEKDLTDTLEYLASEGLLYHYDQEILFEPLQNSKDINGIFSLLEPSKNSIALKNIKEKFPSWSYDKINSLIQLLVENGLAISDDETLWFPQLE